jgi:hypothetical protein
MKTLLVLNIGLENIKGNRVQIHRIIHEIERAGLLLLTSCVVRGQWEGKAEETLVVSGLAYDSPELRPRLYCASRALSQHAIACYANGKGELIGDNPQGYEFDLEKFHFHPERKPVIPFGEPEVPTAEQITTLHAEILAAAYPAKLSECQAMQAKHAAKCAEVDKFGESKSIPLQINGYTKESFLAFLHGTLIPDLIASGRGATAVDFQIAALFIEG